MAYLRLVSTSWPFATPPTQGIADDAQVPRVKLLRAALQCTFNLLRLDFGLCAY